MAFVAVNTIWDEFNDQSIDAKWNIGKNGSSLVTVTEQPDGTLEVDPVIGLGGAFGANFNQDADDGFDPLLASVPFEFRYRLKIPPAQYSASQPSVDGSGIFNWLISNWEIWDNVDADFLAKIVWCYGAVPNGQSMHLLESAYWVEIDVNDSVNGSLTESFSQSWMVSAGRADTTRAFPDHTHNGWFEFRFRRDALNNLTFVIIPDGGSEIDVTPAGISAYPNSVGGKASGYGWGFFIDLVQRNGAGASGITPHLMNYDWVRGAPAAVGSGRVQRVTGNLRYL